MDAQHWRSLGALLSRVHAASVPRAVADRLPVEDYRCPAAGLARTLDALIREPGTHGHGNRSDDPQTEALIGDWLATGDSLAVLLAHIDGLGDELRARSTASVLCHGDAHAANVLLSDDGAVWLLDWDEAVRAPRERDLMFVIGGVLADAPVTTEQQRWFFDGYGPAEIDPIHLAYYRCSWALQDISDFAARILDQSAGPSSARSQALRLFRDVVSSTGILTRAHESLREIGRCERT